MSRTVWILVEASETDEVVVAEELDLLACFFHLNIFCGQRMDTENLENMVSLLEQFDQGNNALDSASSSPRQLAT